MNEVYETETFSKVYNASEKSEQKRIEKIKNQLKENLYVGKPLHFDWFREKKLGNKRLFYVTNTKTNKAILVAFGTKKEQQKIITNIIMNQERYLHLIN